jgi:hypothetical protein
VTATSPPSSNRLVYVQQNIVHDPRGAPTVANNYEAHVVGNRVANQYIAGLISSPSARRNKAPVAVTLNGANTATASFGLFSR